MRPTWNCFHGVIYGLCPEAFLMPVSLVSALETAGDHRTQLISKWCPKVGDPGQTTEGRLESQLPGVQPARVLLSESSLEAGRGGGTAKITLDGLPAGHSHLVPTCPGGQRQGSGLVAVLRCGPFSRTAEVGCCAQAVGFRIHISSPGISFPEKRESVDLSPQHAFQEAGSQVGGAALSQVII